MASSTTSIELDLPYQKLKVRCKRLSGAKLPTKVNPQAVGYDIYAFEDKTLYPFKLTTIDTGCAFEPPKGYYLRLVGVSELSKVHNVHCTEGTIDPDYRGNVKVQLQTHAMKEHRITIGSRIAQLVLTPLPDWEIRPTLDLTPTERGDKAFGEMDKQ
jgi:dUTP pyrophosphatase